MHTIRCANDSSGRQHAEALCTILAQALLRLRLNASILAAQRETERQQLQGIFLAAVSHDLRTPLAVVVGAASALQLQHAKLSTAEQEHLLDSIIKEAGYLSALTENTLQLVRLENTPQSLVRDWESIEEIIGSVLARVRQHDTDKRIQLQLPKGLPLVRVDPVLISQLLANLLENALKYTDGDIQLHVSIQSAQGSDEHNADQHQQWMRISVKTAAKAYRNTNNSVFLNPMCVAITPIAAASAAQDSGSPFARPSQPCMAAIWC
jgi:two-component system sensor histidine kinase KdpD